MNSAIGEAIQGLQNRVAAAYSAIEAMGGTIPATADTANLATAISSIPAGGEEKVYSQLAITNNNNNDEKYIFRNIDIGIIIPYEAEVGIDGYLIAPYMENIAYALIQVFANENIDISEISVIINGEDDIDFLGVFRDVVYDDKFNGLKAYGIKETATEGLIILINKSEIVIGTN